MNFNGKVVLVTGSTTGIGEACVRVFAQSGAAVMVSGRNEQRGHQVVAAIRAAGGHAEFAAADLRAAGASDRLVADTVTRLGALFLGLSACHMTSTYKPCSRTLRCTTRM